MTRLHIQPPGSGGMRFRPSLLVVSPLRELRWKGKLLVPGLFDGEHSFTLESGPDGSVLAESSAPLIVSETGLADRFSLPRADVKVALEPGVRTWTCPYKGHASYWSVPGA